jgi:hAT family C-terminal dimerisation region
VCSDKFETYSDFGNFPLQALESLQKEYPGVFDTQRLKADELTVVYEDQSLRTSTLAQTYQRFVTDTGLKSSFKETVKLCALVLCLPSTSVSAERAFSAMRRVKMYLRSTLQEDRFSNLAFLTIEKEFVSDLQKNKEEFKNLVINKFTQKTRRLEFSFR